MLKNLLGFWHPEKQSFWDARNFVSTHAKKYSFIFYHK